MALNQQSPKYWHPDTKLIDWLTSKVIPDGANVLEVGPGTVPFQRANAYVDFVDIPGLDNFTKADVATGVLPFSDKTFDFVYCRHVLEDSWNPFQICDEMSRVAKAGFIETPSPIVELGRGVDGGSPPFRGYHHHRWIVWTAAKELRFVTKYPFVEYLKFEEDKIDYALKTQRYWNTHYLWQDKINYRHWQSPMDYSIPTSYTSVLAEAMALSRTSTDEIYFPINAT